MLPDLTLRVGEESSIALPSLAGSGYRWSASVDEPAIIRVDRKLTTSPQPPIPPGRSLDEVFVVTAVGPAGETMLRFAQGRSFEAHKPPRATRDVRVRVTG